MNQPSIASERRTYVVGRITERLPAMLDEFAAALVGTPLPAGTAPPAWVNQAIRRFFREFPLKFEVTDTETSLTPKFIGMLSGLVKAGSLSISSPDDLERAKEERIPQLKQLRELFEPFAAKLKALESELGQVSPELGAPKSPQEVLEYHEGGRKAADFVSSDADMSMTADLCFWMWALSPDVEAMGHRETVHEWISQMGFVSCSFKLFEKVCRDIGYCPGSDRVKSST